MAFSASQSHSFDLKIAKAFGVDEAILIHHFQHWIRINQFKKQNLHDGHCWTYQSRIDMQARFPYWNLNRIRRICESLVKKGVIKISNYNESKWDKRGWYAFCDEALFGVDSESASSYYTENSNNVYEGQNCLSKGKIAVGSVKNDLYKDTIPYSLSKKKREEGASPPSPPAPSANASALASYFLDQIKVKKENFVKQVVPSWVKDCERILKIRTQEQINHLIVFAFNHDFWFSKCLSPEKLLKHMDALEIEMNKINPMSKDKELAKKIAEKYPSDFEKNRLSISEKSLIFFNSGAGGDFIFNFGEPGFREKVLNLMIKRNISVEGL